MTLKEKEESPQSPFEAAANQLYFENQPTINKNKHRSGFSTGKLFQNSNVFPAGKNKQKKTLPLEYPTSDYL